MSITTYRWPNDARLALSLVVNVEEGAEMSIVDGDPAPEPVDELGISLEREMRNFGNESNYRYGIEEGFPRVLAMLDRFTFAATWTTAALALERSPHIADAISDRGDEAASHGYRWVHQFGMDEDEERRFLRRAADSIEKTVGTRPVGHLSRYLLTDNTRRLLAEEGFLYHMDDYSRDEPFWADAGSRAIVVVPYAIDTNDMKMWTEPSYTPRQWLDYAIDTFDGLYAEGADRPRMMSLGIHLRVIGRPGRIGALERFLEHVASHSDVWTTTRRSIAEHFSTAVPAP
jgi:allantoinase